MTFIRFLHVFSDLIHLLKSFIADLKNLIAKWNGHPVVGDFFLKHLSLFRAYEFSAEDDVARSLMSLSRYRLKYVQFDEIVKEFESNQKTNNGWSVNDFIKNPAKRLSLYIHILQLLEKYTPSNHEDLPLLQYNISQLSELSVEINTSVNVSEVDNLSKQNELVSAIEGADHLTLSDRKLIKEGGMKVVEIKNSSGSLEADQFYYFFLFNDILVCCSLKTRLSELAKQFEHKATIYLSEIKETNMPDDKHINIFFITGETWVLQNRNSKDNTSWGTSLLSTNPSHK